MCDVGVSSCFKEKRSEGTKTGDKNDNKENVNKNYNRK
jgi:hypothetical protein